MYKDGKDLIKNLVILFFAGIATGYLVGVLIVVVYNYTAVSVALFLLVTVGFLFNKENKQLKAMHDAVEDLRREEDETN